MSKPVTSKANTETYQPRLNRKKGEKIQPQTAFSAKMRFYNKKYNFYSC